MTRLVDLTLYNGEKDLLDIRLKEYADVVDLFYVAEFPQTFSGKYKHVTLQDIAPPPGVNLVTYIGNETVYESPWDREAYQRNSLKQILQPGDIVLLGDLDEFPPKDVLMELKRTAGKILKNKSYTFLSTQCYYYMNMHSNVKNNWLGSCIYVNSGKFLEMELDTIRLSRGLFESIPGGFHYSYLGGIEAIRHKIRCFSHQEFNTEYYLDYDRLQNCISNGLDLFERPYADTFSKVPVTLNTVPKVVFQNLNRYERYVIY